MLRKTTQLFAFLLISSIGLSNLMSDSYLLAKDRRIKLNVAHNDNLYGLCSNGNITYIIANNGVLRSDRGGFIVVNSDNTITYTPPVGFSGHDRFSYGASNSRTDVQPCDTAEVFLWILPNTNCDSTRVVNYSYSFSGNNVTVNVTPSSPPAGYFLQMRKLYFNGDFYFLNSNSITQSVSFGNDTIIIGVEEFFLNSSTGDTCMFYNLDTILKPDCDTNYSIGYSYSLSGDTLVLDIDTITPAKVGAMDYNLQVRYITFNGGTLGSVGNIYDLSSLTSPVVMCVEEWWNPTIFTDTCKYIVCDTLSPGITTSSIDEYKFGKTFSVYPNPAVNQLNFKADLFIGEQVYDVTIMSALGEILFKSQFTGGDHQVDVSSFKEGAYIYILSVDEIIMQTGRFIKQ